MKLTVNDIFTGWLSGAGIFSALSGMPWDSDIISSLDLEYHGNVSGDKPVSPLLLKLYKAEDPQIIGKAAAIIKAVNLPRWEKLYSTLSLEYDPIENYRMLETMTDDETVHEYGRTNTRTDNLTQVIDNQVYGFNSSSAVNSGKSTTTNTGTETDVKTGTQTNARTGTQADALTGSDTDTRNYKLERSGNIGVTTSQQMIESERNLWMWNFFREVVFPDVDKVLTLAIY